jgi:DNA-binding NtrC family response regulator
MRVAGLRHAAGERSSGVGPEAVCALTNCHSGGIPIMEFPASCSRSIESTMPARVLIVDDEPDILDVLRVRLLLEGYIVETTTTGAGAIAAVRERSPDVVLLDLNMPGVLDGRAVLHAIHATVPVIVVTAVNDLRDTRATLQAGAFDFIAKPFDLNRVAEVVAAAVAYRGAL